MAINTSSSWQRLVPWLSAPPNPEGGSAFLGAFTHSMIQGKKEKEDKRRWDETMTERKREFDVLNPSMPGESKQPAWMRESDATMNGPQASAATGAWRENKGTFGGPDFQWGASDFKLDNAAELPVKVASSNNVEEATKWMQHNPEALGEWQRWSAISRRPNPVDKALGIPMSVEKQRFDAQRLKNMTVGAKQLQNDGTLFNKRMAELQSRDNDAWARIIALPRENHPQFGPMPSLAQREQLGAEENRLKTIEQAAIEQRKAENAAAGIVKTGETFKTKEGVETFKVPTASADAMPQGVKDERELLRSQMNQFEGEIGKLQTKINSERKPSVRKQFEDELKKMQSSLREKEGRFTTLGTNWQAAASPPPPMAEGNLPTNVAETERKTADGKIAVYDATTKAFLRWK